MTAAERYKHLLSVIEQQISTEAWKVSMYEKSDPESAAEAKARWDDWATLYDAISEGAVDDMKSEYASRRALVGGMA